ncbi:MAG: asparagine synthase (glutamine-hydrolyzing) [Alphaproteobacteria bacterium]|nr:asparagine synthase (glutamine-hydrolyzing) [Alphaproteobacteria bacterium]
MCGIAGWIDLQEKNAAAGALTGMTDALAHRGPDGHGAYHAATRDGKHAVALGHRRLAIIDPQGGVQPMVSRDHQIALVFNGEIYNFQSLRDELKAQGFIFSTHSDTEVLLNAWRAWGLDSLRRLRGMFAFALWDAGREMLLLARDRFGKKPLFLHHDGDRLIFASEIKALLAYPGVAAKQDKQSALDYLHDRYVPGPHTMFDGITKLMPGSYALWQNGKWSQNPYAVPPDGEQPPPPAAALRDNPVQAFTDKLDESVRLRMIADVPFGAFLSGGVDSAAIVALMSRHSQLPVNTFSVGFEEAAFDETVYAAQIAKQFTTNHHEWRMRAGDVITLLPEAIRFRDAPVAEPTDMALLTLSRHAAQSVKMVLTGEGSDEILAGYPKHRFEPWAARYQSLVPAPVHDKLIAPLIDALPARFYRARTVAQAFALRDAHDRLPRWFGALSLADRAALVNAAITPRAVDPFAFTDAPDISPLRRCLYFDQRSWLPDNLLERGDRMTMAASIESRMPFMDHELAALVAALPDTFRIRNGTQKWILRAAMRHILPPEILSRRKVGFRVPVSLWFRDGLRDYVHDHLLGDHSRTRDFYNRAALQTILAQHVAGRFNHEKLIWTLLSFELFQKEYNLAF